MEIYVQAIPQPTPIRSTHTPKIDTFITSAMGVKIRHWWWWKYRAKIGSIQNIGMAQKSICLGIGVECYKKHGTIFLHLLILYKGHNDCKYWTYVLCMFQKTTLFWSCRYRYWLEDKGIVGPCIYSFIAFENWNGMACSFWISSSSFSYLYHL